MASRNSSRRSEVKLPASKLREATSSKASAATRHSLTSRESFVGGEIIEGKRQRNQKKSYVLDTSDDEDEDAQGEDEDDAPGEDDDMGDQDEDDVEGEIVVEDAMDLDAEGEEDDDEEGLGDEDADGEDDDMEIDEDVVRPTPTIKVSRPVAKSVVAPKTKAPARSAGKPLPQLADSDDEELSDLESDDEDEIQDTVKVGGGDDLGEDDAEGEEDDEIEATGPVGEDDEDDEEDDLGSDDETPGGGSREDTPDLTKMTKRQRARFEDGEGELMKLSDEVQAKKHFTAEELSMRRSEMARRRRNLSEKRNEEVKMETINKLLKKQAPKISRKALNDDDPDGEGYRPNSIFVRWISDKNGSRVAVPAEMLAGPAGRVFVPGGLKSGKMVEEVS